MWAVEDDADSKCLKAKSLSEFRERLKSSFGSSLRVEEPVALSCLVCCEPISRGAKLSRKCLKAAFPCSGARCSCAERSVCYDCYSELLWKSPRSQAKLGRFRATCPACRAEYCHYDVVELVGKPVRAVLWCAVFSPFLRLKAPVAVARPVQTRHAMERVCLDAEKQAIEEFARRAPAPPPDDAMGVEAAILRFRVGEEKELALRGLTGAQRAVAHKVAESLGLEHVSQARVAGGATARALTAMQGEGSKRCLWVRKLNPDVAGPAMTDELLWKGYVALQGPSVDHAAHQHVGAVDASWVEQRQCRDGKAAG